MNPVTDAAPRAALDLPEAAPAPLRRTRPLFWSLRREVWEHRSIWMAPAGVAAFVVVGLVVHGITMPSHLPGMIGTDPAPGAASFTYRFSAALLMLTAALTGGFYCLDALSGERRDRAILFWKSLPVSDRTTVFAKAGIPLVVLPLVTAAAILAMHVVMLALASMVLLVQGHGLAALWRDVQLLRLWPASLYGVVAMTLWYAPLYGLLLLVSGWSRRTAALWAVLPVLAVLALEQLTMGTWRVYAFVVHRLAGWWWEAFVYRRGENLPLDPMNRATPAEFFALPDLWIGLLFAAACLAAAVRLRRYREPA